MHRASTTLALAFVLALGCDGDPPPTDAGGADAGGRLDAGGGADAGATDAGGGDAGAPDASAPDAGPPLTESEPNDGTPVEDVDVLPLGAVMEGAIATPGDADVFSIATEGATLYRVTLTAPAGSALDGHLTILDSGRDTDPAGGDFIKIATGPAGGDAELEFFAMGDGHYVIVRDARDVGASSPSEGSAAHRYRLTVTPVDRAPTPIAFPSVVDGTLAAPSSVALYGFDATEGTDHRFDIQASGAAGTLDLRAYVVAESTGSWIARNDDRAVGDPDPLLDAPLFASGAMVLVVENPNGDGTTLGFSIDASRP